ncbi:MAG: Crp/Fnr family transcriptional regulator [Halothiobacillaceae bacterium]
MADQISAEEIKNTALGAELTLEQCGVLAHACRLRRLDSGEVLFEEGESDDELFIILSGKLAVSRASGRGFSNTLHLLGPGSLAGESGFLDSKPHSATLRAVGQTEVMSLKREKLESLLFENPVIVYGVMRAIVRSVREIVGRMNKQYQEMTDYINQFGSRF